MVDYLDKNFDASNKDKKAIAETFVYRIWMVYGNDYLWCYLDLMNEEIWQAELASIRYIYNRCQFRAVSEIALEFSSKELFTILINSDAESCNIKN